MDAATGAPIEEWRDTTTGAELYQSPARIALLYGKTQALGAAQPSTSVQRPSFAATSSSPISTASSQPQHNVSLTA
ncbi:MAG: hypothetical protein HQL37_01130 [Alphaproteobacteria bacterium]|nr:hypothetical protein [Alphaproteobacteria bacterium]